MEDLEKELHRLYVLLNNTSLFDLKFEVAKRIKDIEEYLKMENGK